MSDFKSGFVAIVGDTNAGKSTFLNAVLGENIAITSRKEQTTRKNIKGIYTDDEVQIVFIDTPGIHDGKRKLDLYMDLSIEKALEDVELVLYVVDAAHIDEKKIKEEFDKLKDHKVIILLNKIDLVSHEERMEKSTPSVTSTDIREANGVERSIPNLVRVLPISALKKENLSLVIKEIKNQLPKGEKFYDEDTLSDTNTRDIAKEMIREACLHKLEKEVPHGINVEIESFLYKNKCYHISALIICEKENHKAIIIGKCGAMIKNIGTEARIHIEKFLDKKVNLKLLVKTKKNWREKDSILKDFGFDKRQI